MSYLSQLGKFEQKNELSHHFKAVYNPPLIMTLEPFDGLQIKNFHQPLIFF